MILGSTDSFLCFVVDRHELQRGRWDGRRAFDIAVYIGGLGIHVFWPGLRSSYVNHQRRTR